MEVQSFIACKQLNGEYVGIYCKHNEHRCLADTLAKHYTDHGKIQTLIYYNLQNLDKDLAKCTPMPCEAYVCNGKDQCCKAKYLDTFDDLIALYNTADLQVIYVYDTNTCTWHWIDEHHELLPIETLLNYMQ